MTGIIRELADRKKSGCPICAEFHAPATRCRFEAMAGRITKLLEANKLIPSLLAANQEATKLAQYYQGLLNKADAAHTILMTILEGHEEIGEQIAEEYIGALDTWATPYINQNTAEPLQPSVQESSTPNETEDKPSTTTESGGSSLILS